MGPPWERPLESPVAAGSTLRLRNVVVVMEPVGDAWQAVVRNAETGNEERSACVLSFDEATQSAAEILSRQIPNARGRCVIAANGLRLEVAAEEGSTPAEETPLRRAA